MALKMALTTRKIANNLGPPGATWGHLAIFSPPGKYKPPGIYYNTTETKQHGNHLEVPGNIQI
jgi:hypothetical protein